MPTYHRLFGLFLAVASAAASAQTATNQACALQPEHAAIVVMQSPPVVKAKAAGGCPAADYSEGAPGMAAFQVRNLCAKSGDGILGNYLVELNSGQVWETGDVPRRVDSLEVRSTRTRMCSLSVKGVIPSLLPQGHTSRAAVRRVGTSTTARKRSASAAAARKKPPVRVQQ